MFDVGALTTMTPRSVAAATSTLSRPMPARATTLRFGAAASASASIWVALRIITAAASASAGSSAARSAPSTCRISTSLAEHLQDARGELFGDQDDGQGRGHGATA